MGKNKRSKLPARKYINTSTVLSEGKVAYQPCLRTDDKAAVLQLGVGVFSSEKDAAKAADLAMLALGRRGTLNFVRGIYLQKHIDKERERLRQLGVLPRQPKRKAGRSKEQPAQQQQQQQVTSRHASSKAQRQHQEEPLLATDEEQQRDWTVSAAEAAAGGSKANRKRKAASPIADTAVASSRARDQQQRVGHAATPTTGAAEDGRQKRRRVQHEAAESPSADVAPAKKPHSRHASPSATALTNPRQQPAPVSTALVPAVPPALVLPTGGAVQMGAPHQEALLRELQSALNAHQQSQKQLNKALKALDASAGQLKAVAHAMGLQV